MIFNAFLLTIIAGLSTTIGSTVIWFRKFRDEKYLNIFMGFAAGVMIFVSFAEMLPESAEGIGFFYALVAFFTGMALIFLVDVFVPHDYEEECNCEAKKVCNLKRCGTMIAIGIAIHNFPEGIAVLFSALNDLKLGISIAIAIALHNIPEGIAISVPIYHSTKSKWKAFYYSAISGLAEPIGAIIAFIFLRTFITPTVLDFIVGMVAGIMVFISFDELLPRAYNHENHHQTIFGIIIGMVVMAISILLIGNI
ncbi:zinc transporter ZupT [Candidatus Woesearchaeota archaeon]|nr:zinc transporter ZupT [Candidatus Woesearchaeota archaeon]